jgi:hypothetical protein
LLAAMKRVNPQASVWSVSSTKENGLEGSTLSWTLGKTTIMQMDFYVADEKTIETRKIGLAKFAENFTDGLEERAKQAKIDAKGVKSSVATEGNIIRLRFELPQPVLEMLVGDFLKKE